ncbi:glycine zipper 2TM domain-containing protein [Methylibium sp.]|uniref:glycine zipper 2TM domain-containing protein n=1 Tax=Methylibium sp. TaxID=2067992 RepID=UPI003D0B073A
MDTAQASNATSGGAPRWMWVAGGAVALTIAGVASALALQRAQTTGPATTAEPVEQPAPAAPRPVAKAAAAAATPRSATQEPATEAQAAVCAQCGVVESVQSVKVKGEAHGVGAVAGGVLGGVVGNQFGKGNGRAAMTVLGAVGGGFAGHEIEKNVKAKTVYNVRVRMDDGSVRTLQQSQAPGIGARVKVEGSTLRAA